MPKIGRYITLYGGSSVLKVDSSVGGGGGEQDGAGDPPLRELGGLGELSPLRGVGELPPLEGFGERGCNARRPIFGDLKVGEPPLVG